MTTPITPPRSSYVPLTTTETNTRPDITRVEPEKTDYSKEDLQQAGTSLVARTGAGDRAMGPAKTITASKASDTLAEFTGYDGDISDLLAKMASTMADVFRKLRKNALEGQMVSLQTQVKAMQGQAGKMRDSADKNYKAALIQGWTQFAGGAVGLAGGAVAMRSSVKAGQEVKKEQGPAPASAAKASSVSEEPSSFDDLMAQAGTGRPRANAVKGTRPAETTATPAAGEPSSFDDLVAQAGKGRERANAFKGTRPAEETATPVPAESASAPSAGAASAQRVDLLNAQSRLAMDASQSVGSVVTSFGGISSAGEKHDADLIEAENKELEAVATQAAADLAQENELAQTWKESGQRLVDNLKAAFDQEQSTAKDVTKNI